MTAEGRPAGVRRSIQLPRRSGESPLSRRANGASTADVAAEARAAVVRAVERRGGVAREVRDGRRVELVVESPAGRRRVRVSSRRRGDWQTSIREGDRPSPGDLRFWIFVDLSGGDPGFYVAPEASVADDIRREHEEYLVRNGGRRARTPDSEHHRIQTWRVARWRDRWDLLGLSDTDLAMREAAR